MSSLRMARLLLAAAYEAGSLRFAFDPDQARDDFGRWTSGSGSDQSWKKEDRKQGSLNGVSFQEEPSPDFSRSVNKAIAEPPFPDLPRGKHAAAGVVVTEPDGRVWMVQPFGKYGGYKNTFPKGTIDIGEHPQETAAREVWEETGLVVEITGHLADVERSTSVTRFYEGRRIGGAPWAHGKETYAVRLLPIEGKKIEGALKSVFGAKTSDHRVLDALRRLRASRLLAEYDEAEHPRDEIGRWTDAGGDWPSGLTNVSGAKGSNPGGLYKDASGQKWYVKRYNDPRQAATEHIANAVYHAVGVDAPHSVLGEGGDYASKWQPSDGTLAQAGITKERADRILDGFAADVFLDNWDAVGTGHDNVLVKGDRVTRIDQGGTLIFRAQGALKPESGLEKIDEWDSLVEKNVYYNRIFKAAGVKNGDALGERAAKQIDRIVKARPSGGWKTLVDRVAPKADAAFRAKVAKMLEKRQTLLERKRDQLRELKTLGGPGSGNFGHAGRPGEVGGSAPESSPVVLTNDERETLRLYTQSGGTYREVNGALRSGKKLDDNPTVTLLDRTFKTHGEEAPHVVYRGIAGYDPEELNLEEGSEFTDPGFVSTTRDVKEAKKFAFHGSDRLSGDAVGIIFKIQTRGIRALNMSPFSRYGERETLLNRGTRFRVKSVREGIPGESLSRVTLEVLQ